MCYGIQHIVKTYLMITYNIITYNPIDNGIYDICVEKNMCNWIKAVLYFFLLSECIFILIIGVTLVCVLHSLASATENMVMNII